MAGIFSDAEEDLSSGTPIAPFAPRQQRRLAPRSRSGAGICNRPVTPSDALNGLRQLTRDPRALIHRTQGKEVSPEDDAPRLVGLVVGKNCPGVSSHRRSQMVRWIGCSMGTILLSVILGISIGSAQSTPASPPTPGSGQTSGDNWLSSQSPAVQQDIQNLKQDAQTLHQDWQKLQADEKAGNQAAVTADQAALKADQQAVAQDRAALKALLPEKSPTSQDPKASPVVGTTGSTRRK